MKAKNDSRVLAIRANEKVGRGSCSSIDECWDSSELVEALDAAGITDAAGAVAWALESEGLHLEAGLNARWGEDDDPQLARYREFHDDGPEEVEALCPPWRGEFPA